MSSAIVEMMNAGPRVRSVIRVDLPAPLGPMMQQVWPRSTARLTLLRMSGPPGRSRPLAPHVGARAAGAARLHTDDVAALVAEAHHARALTVGADVYFGRGEDQPGTERGDELLAHELTHVAQGQRGELTRAAAKGITGGTHLDPSEAEKRVEATGYKVVGGGAVGRGAASDAGHEEILLREYLKSVNTSPVAGPIPVGVSQNTICTRCVYKLANGTLDADNRNTAATMETTQQLSPERAQEIRVMGNSLASALARG
jgi:hypothetical protein